MSAILIAEFAEAGTLREAAELAGRGDYELVDAFTPFPVDGLAELLGAAPNRIRLIMFLGGALGAAGAYLTEWYSAVVGYPINSGGRPLHSWPAFMLVPVAVGILVAAIAGFAALMAGSGLPRLHHPLFDVEGFERASQDAFFLAIRVPDGEADPPLAERLRHAGARSVTEVSP